MCGHKEFKPWGPNSPLSYAGAIILTSMIYPSVTEEHLALCVFFAHNRTTARVNSHFS